MLHPVEWLARGCDSPPLAGAAGYNRRVNEFGVVPSIYKPSICKASRDKSKRSKAVRQIDSPVLSRFD